MKFPIKKFFISANTFLFIILLIISFFILEIKSQYHKTKIYQLSTYIVAISNKPYKRIFQYFRLQSVNENLVKENTYLKNQLFLKQNKKEYSVNYNNNLQYSFINARVLKNSRANAQNYLILDRGLNSGIKKDMGVVTEQGIVGVINYVSDNFSSVTSILNLTFKLNAKLKNSDGFGSLSWTGTGPKKMILSDIAISDSIKINDTIVTGGKSVYFPLGIPLGKITDIKLERIGSYYKINVEMFEDLNRIENVYIIKNKFAQEFKTIDSLNKTKN